MPQFPIEQDALYDNERKKYGVPIPSRDYIADALRGLRKPQTLKMICHAFGIRGQRCTEAMRRRLIAMRRDGQVMIDRRGHYFLFDEKSQFVTTGIVRANKDGSGWLETTKFPERTIFLSSKQMQRVFPGDEVQVAFDEEMVNERCSGYITKVIKHNTWVLSGKFYQEEGQAYVVPLDPKISQHIQLQSSPSGLINGQQVQVEILQQPTLESGAVAKVLSVGAQLAPLEIALSQAKHTFELKESWPEASEAQVSAYAKTVEPDAKRKDLSHLPFVTIDGEDARDFDDAVYAEKKKAGGWRLYVAIADVSFYIPPHSPLDKEAQNRSTSVYFPNYVIPMLPEALSNDLCSLKPHVTRLALVCEMTISSTGRTSSYQFYPANIMSKARLTYNQVSAYLTDDVPLEAAHSPEVEANVVMLWDLFQALEQQRQQRGAVNFEVAEPKICIDDQGQVDSVQVRERNVAHKIIEECMLCANVCAAKFLLKNKLPSLFRVHEPPSQEKMQDLRDYLSLLGIHSKRKGELVPQDYNAILAQVQDRPDFNTIQMSLLRSMSQARYQPNNMGHFGLAYTAYTHFTSPIRRYPDLIVHRSIRYLLNYKDLSAQAYDLEDLEQLGIHTSARERRADEASRFVQSLLKASYVEQFVGETLPGVVSGVTNFGLFVTLDDLQVDGLIHVSNLHGDYYHYDTKAQCLKGERSGRVFRMGDALMVQVAQSDASTGKIDFMLAQHPSSQAKKLLAKPRKRQQRKKK